MLVVINLQEYVLCVLEEYPSPHAMAKDNGWSYGLVYRGLAGYESDTLRKQIRCTKHPPRDRLIIATALRDQYDAQATAHGMSRAEFLAHVLKADRNRTAMGNGFGELEY